jgi:hypothetical protein
VIEVQSLADRLRKKTLLELIAASKSSSRRLRSAALEFDFFDMDLAEFILESSEEDFLDQTGLWLPQYVELARLVGERALRVHRNALGPMSRGQLQSYNTAETEIILRSVNVDPIIRRDAYDILNTTQLREIIAGSDAGKTLVKAVDWSPLFEMTVATFLTDSESEVRFLEIDGIVLGHYLELCDLINTFTDLIHKNTIHSFCEPILQTLPAIDPSHYSGQAATPENRTHPDEILGSTTVSEFILRSNAGSALRNCALTSTYFANTLSYYIADDEVEKTLLSSSRLSSRDIEELNDRVNAHITLLYRSYNHGH